MPTYKTPQSFPGLSSLPTPLQGLVEGLFPKDQLPTPATIGGSSGSSGALAWLQKALGKGGGTKVPVGGSNAVPGASQSASEYPFKAYGDEILDETFPVSQPTPAWEGLRQIQSKLWWK